MRHRRRAAHPQPLPAAQRVKISGVAPRSVDAGLRGARGRRGHASCRPDTTSTTRASRASCGRSRASSCRRWAGPGPHLPGARGAVQLVPRSVRSSSPGSVPLAMFGALIFTFLKFAGPPGLHFRLTDGWTTTLNIYSQVGLVTLVGAGVQERHPHRAVRQRPAGAGAIQARRGEGRRRDPPPADPHDDVRDGRGSLPPDARHRPRRGGAKLDRPWSSWAGWRSARSSRCSSSRRSTSSSRGITRSVRAKTPGRRHDPRRPGQPSLAHQGLLPREPDNLDRADRCAGRSSTADRSRGTRLRPCRR